MFYLDRDLGPLGGVLAIVLWSAAALLICLLSNLPAFEMMAISCGLACVVQLLVSREALQWKNQLIPVLCFLVTEIGYVLAFHHAPAQNVDLINYLWPLLVLLGAGFIPGGTLRPLHIGGAVIGFTGLMALGIDWTASMDHLFGYILALAGALGWTAYTLYVRMHPKRKTNFALCFGVSSILCLVTHLALESFVVPEAKDWALLVIYGGGVVGSAYNFWEGGIKSSYMHSLSVCSYFIPVGSILGLVAGGFTSLTTPLATATGLVAIGGALPPLVERIRSRTTAIKASNR